MTDREMKSCWLDAELHKQLKALAANEVRSFQATLDEAVREYITNRQFASYTQTRAASDHIAQPNEM